MNDVYLSIIFFLCSFCTHILGCYNSCICTGLALQRIRINEAPVGGTCTAEVAQDTQKEDEEDEEEEEEGSFEAEARVEREEPTILSVTALIDTVILNCSGWEDPEGFEILKYSFFGKRIQYKI